MKSIAWAAALLATQICMAATSADNNYHGGKPAATKPSVADLESQVAYQRAFEAAVWGMPLVNTHRLRLGVMEGNQTHDNDIVSFSKPATSRHEMLTANNTTPYVAANMDLRKGPVVIDVPARTDKALLFAQVINAWGVTLESLGPAGPDQGKGGKYLMLPPGYELPVPDGYIAVRSDTFRISLAARPIHGPKGSDAEAVEYGRTLRIYPLAEAANPAPNRIVDGYPNHAYTLPRYDLNYYQDLYEVVSVEPVKARDKVMMGMLASIGIERGKPFAPQGKVKAAMERAIVDAYFYMQRRTAHLEADHPFWKDRHWGAGQITDPDHGFEFETADQVLIDNRADIFHAASYFPKKLLPGKVPVMYLVASADSQGRPFAAGASYRIHVPADIPATQFWSIVPYDEATWAFVYNDLDRVGLSSFDKDRLKVNADGSVDIYFGATPPPQGKSNWIPIGKSIAVPQLRLYGVGESLWNGSFKMPDVERLK
ncbi:MAG: DUF1214 domain-containing protein [Pseudomonadota bacterium]